MRRLDSFWHVRSIVFFLSILVLLTIIASANAAYQTTRPITEGTYGYIHQYYLYGEDGHKGIDFPAALDTDVIAVADGIVRDVYEECLDTQCSSFGNYILVRHTRQHRDRTTGQMAYVYSLYAHLSWHGAFVNVNDNVVAGLVIGDVDDTGNSDGNHLHLQIMIDPDPNRTVDLSWTEIESRNPELWIRPYSGNTGTVIGKVTNTDGSARGGVTIYGLDKPILGGYDYGSSLTYNSTALKPDDILVENWGTTDVTPGRYYITTDVPGNLGWHDVVAGQVTYAGLYPVWLPYVRNKNGWNSTVLVRNNSDTYRAQVNVTLFNRDGTVYWQRASDYINARALLSFGVPSDFDGSVLVVSSEDIAVVVREQSGDELDVYNGITALTGAARHGWEKTGPVVYAPVVKKSWWSRTSKLLIMNAGQTATTASIQLYKSDGSVSGSPIAQALAVWGSASVSGSACADPAGLCSARISASNNQPLAVVVLEQTDGTTQNRSTHNACSFGTTANYLPLARKNANGQKSVLWIQNVGVQPTNVSVTCYDRGSQTYTACASASNVPSMKTVLVDLTTTALPDGFEGSCQVTSSGQPLATIIHETGDPNKMSTSAPQDGSLLAIAPEVYGSKVLNGQTWDSSLFVQNVGGTAAQVTVTYYNEAGGVVTSYSTPSLGPKRMWKLSTWDSNLPANFKGSAVIQSTQKVAGVVNTYHTGSGDTRASYIVSNR